MNFYLTSGTADFMEKLRVKYAKENMILLHGTRNSVLLHETNGKTKFATPRKFEVIDQRGSIEQRGYFILHHIPVSDEGRPIFEKHVLTKSNTLESEPGLIAYRFLRPIKSDTYILLSQWTGLSSYKTWKSANVNIEATLGVKKQNIFNAASYETTYSGKLNEEE